MYDLLLAVTMGLCYWCPAHFPRLIATITTLMRYRGYKIEASVRHIHNLKTNEMRILILRFDNDKPYLSSFFQVKVQKVHTSPSSYMRFLITAQFIII